MVILVFEGYFCDINLEKCYFEDLSMYIYSLIFLGMRFWFLVHFYIVFSGFVFGFGLDVVFGFGSKNIVTSWLFINLVLV